MIKKFKKLRRGHTLLVVLMEKLERFTKSEFQKTNQKQFKVEKGIMEKSKKLYVKWKGYDHMFNSWIDKKDIV